MERTEAVDRGFKLIEKLIESGRYSDTDKIGTGKMCEEFKTILAKLEDIPLTAHERSVER